MVRTTYFDRGLRALMLGDAPFVEGHSLVSAVACGRGRVGEGKALSILDREGRTLRPRLCPCLRERSRHAKTVVAIATLFTASVAAIVALACLSIEAAVPHSQKRSGGPKVGWRATHCVKGGFCYLAECAAH